MIETRVFGSQYGLLEDGRNVLEAHQRASLFAELSDQGPVSGVHAKRNLGPIVGQGLDRRNVVIRQNHREGDDGTAEQGKSGDDAERK